MIDSSEISVVAQGAISGKSTDLKNLPCGNMIICSQSARRRKPFVAIKPSFSLRMRDVAYKKREKRLESLLIGMPLEKAFNLFFRLYKRWPNEDKAFFNLLIDEKRAVCVECNGKNLQFASIFSSEYKNGYEPETATLIDLLVGETGVFYDIGSNWGYFSLYVGSRQTYKGTVHAFEPVLSTFNDLVDVVSKSGLGDKIKCHQIALSNKTGVGEMIFPDNVHSGYATLVNGHKVDEKKLVKCETLDSLEIVAPDVIKIDAEGSESSILEGGTKILTSKKPMIIFENWIYPNDLGKTFTPLSMLKDMGYEFYLPCFLRKEGNIRYCVYEKDEISESEVLAIMRFDIAERLLLPNRINCFACHKENIEKLESVFYENCAKDD